MNKDYAHFMQGDIISRADAIRWVKTECNPYGKPTLDFESGKRVMEHLEQMPSAEPKTMKIGGEIPMAKEVKAMTIENLVAIASKYNMYLSISLAPLNKEADDESNTTKLQDPDTDI